MFFVKIYIVVLLNNIMISKEKREIIVNLHLKGKRQQDIADIVGESQQVISYWIVRFKETSSINERPKSGRPTKLKDDVLIDLKNKILNKIKSANADFGCVSTKEIKDLIKKEINETYSIRHVERIMHKLGFNLITPRTTHVRHNQEKANNFRKEFKKNSYRLMWTMK